MKKHSLIAGGGGFIGSHLAEGLLGEGDGVTVLDDLSTGAEGNIAHLRGREGFHVVRDSVENEATVNILVSGCDAVFHLASAVGVQLVADEPIRAMRTTVHGAAVGHDVADRHGKPARITCEYADDGKR